MPGSGSVQHPSDLSALGSLAVNLRVALKCWAANGFCLLTLGDSLSWVGGILAVRASGRASRAPSNPLFFRPEIRQDYPPNLSILISGGKENNCDAPSNGEWNGQSPSPNCRLYKSRGMWCLGASYRDGAAWISPPWQGPRPIEGDRPVFPLPRCADVSLESKCLGVHFKVRGKLLVRLNMTPRPIANKYREGKLQRTLKREFKSTWNGERANGRNWASSTRAIQPVGLGRRAHLAPSERGDRLRGRLKRLGKVAAGSRRRCYRPGTCRRLSGRGAPAAPSLLTESATRRRRPAGRVVKLLPKFGVARPVASSGAVSRGARGPSRVVPGTPSDPSWNTDQGVDLCRESQGPANPHGVPKGRRVRSGVRAAPAQHRPAARSLQAAAERER